MAGEVSWLGDMVQQMMEQQQLMYDRLQMMEDTQQHMIQHQQMMEKQMIQYQQIMEKQMIDQQVQQQQMMQKQVQELSTQRHLTLQREFDRRREIIWLQAAVEQLQQAMWPDAEAGAEADAAYDAEDVEGAGAGDAADDAEGAGAGDAADDSEGASWATDTRIPTRERAPPMMGTIVEETTEERAREKEKKGKGKSCKQPPGLEGKGKSYEEAEDKRCDNSGGFMKAIEKVSK